MNSRLSSYSALNQIRIRIVNLNYVVSVDTYSIDTNKTILNPRVFDIFSNHKNSSGYDKKTGNIQAAVRYTMIRVNLSLFLWLILITRR